MGGLKELYECFDDFLQLPSTQQALSVEEALNGSLGLLDMCSTTRDFFSQMRECMQEIESSIRRKRGGESIFNEVDAYMVSNKKLNKAISKYLKNLKKQEKNCRTTTLSNNSNLADTIVMSKGVEEISVSVFESILSSISHPKAKSKFSAVSKFLQLKHSSPEGKVEANEVEKIDTELLALKSSKDMNQVQNALKGLEALGLSLQEAEEELECVYRRLVKIRASLLNILSR